MKLPFLTIFLLLAIALSPVGSAPSVEETKEWAREMVLLDEKLAKNPDDYSALTKRAYLRGRDLSLKDWKIAIQHLIEREPKNPLLLVERAIGNHLAAKSVKIADCEQALALNPKCVPAYARRAELRKSSGDLPGALSDWNRAVALSPGDAHLYLLRGTAREDSGDIEGALKDFDQAVMRNDKSSAAFTCRARINHKRNDLQAAMSDYNQALAVDPTDADNEIRPGRGNIHYVQKNYEAALADFRASSAHTLFDEYEWFFAYVSEVRCGRAGAARASLRAWMRNEKAEHLVPWSKSIGAFLLGEIDEAALLKATAKGEADELEDRQCEAWFYAGIVKLAAGKKEEAIERFRKCIATGAEDMAEMDFAKADLKVLEAK